MMVDGVRMPYEQLRVCAMSGRRWKRWLQEWVASAAVLLVAFGGLATSGATPQSPAVPQAPAGDLTQVSIENLMNMEVPPSPNFSSSCATPPARQPPMAPAAFSTPVSQPTALRSPASSSSISTTSKILHAPTLPFPPARSPRRGIACPSPCPPASSAITTKFLSVISVSHLRILCANSFFLTQSF